MSSPPGPHPLLTIARDSIKARFSGVAYEPPPLPPALDGPAGVFVTLFKGRELRGCIGHIEPLHERLAEEVAECAQLSAFADTRFSPLRPHELAEVTLEISILQPTEPITDLSTLDPHRYGVVVQCGRRRGVLLPDVRGVETVDQQLAIALRKAGIAPTESWTVERFEVQKVEEDPVP